MLTRDQEFFDRNFPSAASFLRAANLRTEMYGLAHTYKVLTEWQVSRIHELIRCPACRETWFVVMLRDCKDLPEEFLLAAGV